LSFFKPPCGEHSRKGCSPLGLFKEEHHAFI
jgi:hypothetical protein